MNEDPDIKVNVGRRLCDNDEKCDAIINDLKPPNSKTTKLVENEEKNIKINVSTTFAYEHNIYEGLQTTNSPKHFQQAQEHEEEYLPTTKSPRNQIWDEREKITQEHSPSSALAAKTQHGSGYHEAVELETDYGKTKDGYETIETKNGEINDGYYDAKNDFVAENLPGSSLHGDCNSFKEECVFPINYLKAEVTEDTDKARSITNVNEFAIAENISPTSLRLAMMASLNSNYYSINMNNQATFANCVDDQPGMPQECEGRIIPQKEAFDQNRENHSYQPYSILPSANYVEPFQNINQITQQDCRENTSQTHTQPELNVLPLRPDMTPYQNLWSPSPQDQDNDDTSPNNEQRFNQDRNILPVIMRNYGEIEHFMQAAAESQCVLPPILPILMVPENSESGFKMQNNHFFPAPFGDQEKTRVWNNFELGMDPETFEIKSKSLIDYSRLTDEGVLPYFQPRPKSVKQKDLSECRYECSYTGCGRSFNRPYTLKMHELIHTGEKPFICGICGEGFRQSGTRLNHIRAKHTKERPYQCPYCRKTFTHKSSITVHIRIHTKQKPHQCEQCGRRFTDRATYLKHQTIHSGIKPYQCEACLKCFSQKSNLKRHYKNVHEKPPVSVVHNVFYPPITYEDSRI